jgi:hypothetical protein
MTATQSFDDPDVVVDDADMLDDEAEVRGWGGAKIGSAHPRGRARVRRNAGRENLVPDSVMGARLRP